jgi:hypothetical protein
MHALIGTWLPFLLIFLSSWFTGKLVWRNHMGLTPHKE